MAVHPNTLKNLRPWPKGVSGNPRGKMANPLGRSALRALKAKMPVEQADAVRKNFPSLKKNPSYADALTALAVQYGLMGFARGDPQSIAGALRCVQLLCDLVECNIPKTLEEPMGGIHGKLSLEQTIETLAATYGLNIQIPREPQTVDVIPNQAALPPGPERTQ